MIIKFDAGNLLRVLSKIFLCLISVSTASGQVDLPNLDLPGDYAQYFMHFTAKPQTRFNPVYSIHLHATPRASNSGFRSAEHFLENLPAYESLLSKMPLKDAETQYEGVLAASKCLEQTPSWGTYVISKCLALTILEDIRQRLINAQISGNKASQLIAKIKLPTTESGKIEEIINSETDKLSEIESAIKRRSSAKIPNASLRLMAIHELDDSEASSPGMTYTLKGGNYGGLWELDNAVTAISTLTEYLVEYIRLGGDISVNCEQFESSFRVLGLAGSDDSTDLAKRVYDLIHLPHLMIKP